MKKPRHLSPEERALWETVTQRIIPAHVRRKLEPATKDQEEKKLNAIREIESFTIGEHSKPQSATTFSGGPIVSPLKMDAKSFGKLKKGKLRPEATLDLHGMTIAQAHPELNSFVLNAYSQQKRLVLVITGKGRSHDDTSVFGEQRGVLRRQVPNWLRLPPLHGVVLQVQAANIRHGGDGALYVYLKRAR